VSLIFHSNRGVTNAPSLAYHEMRLILASVLLHFDLELGNKQEVWTDQQSYWLWDKKPLMIKLKSVG
jgi:cytochrome P450